MAKRRFWVLLRLFLWRGLISQLSPNSSHIIKGKETQKSTNSKLGRHREFLRREARNNQENTKTSLTPQPSYTNYSLAVTCGLPYLIQWWIHDFIETYNQHNAIHNYVKFMPPRELDDTWKPRNDSTLFNNSVRLNHEMNNHNWMTLSHRYSVRAWKVRWNVALLISFSSLRLDRSGLYSWVPKKMMCTLFGANFRVVHSVGVHFWIVHIFRDVVENHLAIRLVTLR